MSNPIKELRDEAGFSQADLAVRLAVSPEHIHRMEKGTKAITKDILAKLAIVKIERLVEGRDTPIAKKIREIASGWR